MTDISEKLGRASASSNLRNRLTRLRNLLNQGVSDLVSPLRSRHEQSEVYIKIDDDGVRLCHRSSLKSKAVNRETLEAFAKALPGEPIDFVFSGSSCVDLSFVLPSGLLDEVSQMAENEIRYNSPFTEEASLSFWSSQELSDGRWQTNAAVTLREPVAQALSLVEELGLTVGRVERSSKTSNFFARPDWASRKSVPRNFLRALKNLPSSLKLVLLGATIFCISSISYATQSAMTASALRAQSEDARARLAEQMRSSREYRQLDESIRLSSDKLALTGQLSQLLPDEVWIDQLIIENDTVTLVGYGPSAADVTRLLASLKQLSDVRFASPVTRDNTQSIERFRIAATLVGAEK